MTSPADGRIDGGPEPPTRLQRHQAGESRSATTDPAASAPQTRIQNSDAGEPHTRIQPTGTHSRPHTRIQQQASGTDVPGGGDSAGCAPGHGPQLPAELVGDYDLVRRIGTGGEADVYLARAHPGTPGPDHVAIKLYRPGFVINIDTVAKLDDTSYHRYVPKMFGYGNGEATSPGSPAYGWEVMEYFPEGSLHDYRIRNGGRLSEHEVRGFVAELADALTFWEQQIKSRQMDFSPGNILLRRGTNGIELVISDSGGVVGTGESQHIGEIVGKLQYLAPAVFANVRSEHNAWWALGMIVHELLTGALPGAWATATTTQALQAALAQFEPDVDQLPERWRLLVAGLLTRDPAYRWQASQVRAWLAGKSPDVRRGQAPASTSQAPPITYRGEQFRDVALLALRLADDGDRAVGWLTTGGAKTLLAWLNEDVKDTALDRGVLRTIGDDELMAARAVATMAATYVPATTPRYRGRQVDAVGLAVIAGSGDAALLSELTQTFVLYESAKHTCTRHAGCTSGCAVVQRVADDVPQIVRKVQGLWRSAGQTADLQQIYVEATTLIVDPHARRAGLPADRYEPDWWKRLRLQARSADLRTIDGVAAVVATSLLAGRMRTLFDTQRDQRRTEHERLVRARRQARHAAASALVGMVIFFGIMFGIAHAFGFWFMTTNKLGAEASTDLWPQAWEFVRATLLPPVTEFTQRNPLSDPLSEFIAPRISIPRDHPVEWWMLAAFPVLLMLTWRGNRVTRSALWPVNAITATALSATVVLNCYATGAVFLLNGLLLLLLWAGIAAIALALLGILGAVFSGR